jgi:hypothetical protein
MQFCNLHATSEQACSPCEKFCVRKRCCFHSSRPASWTKMVKCCQEKLYGRARGAMQSFCWLYRLISGKQAKNLSVGKTKSYGKNNTLLIVTHIYQNPTLFHRYLALITIIAWLPEGLLHICDNGGPIYVISHNTYCKFSQILGISSSINELTSPPYFINIGRLFSQILG